MVLVHIAKRLLRHEMPHVAPFLHTLADKGGGNFQNRGLQNSDGRMMRQFSPIVAFAGENQQSVFVQNLLVLAPMVQVLQAVHSANEDKAAVGVLL